MTNPRPAAVLCLSGIDPTGGAGLQADIEACAALGAHALGLPTALTAQDSGNVAAVFPVAPETLQAQLDCLLSDCPVQAIKVGLIGGIAQLAAVIGAIDRCRCPVIVDPVLRAGGGHDFAGDDLMSALLRDLLPLTTLATPNAAEARRLVPEAIRLDDCGAALLDTGCANVLITGGDEPGVSVENRWYRRGQAVEVFRWPRLPGPFHGAGCTLAAALAARLAQGADMADALADAQRYAHQSLQRAFPVGNGRAIPGRL